ncbi:hypothetical protein KUTeg_018789 [Tegillarca granosa]|uniref:Uncharacterized protein n=1 Tax=Tegillarca granosa TaxID=220873 RepID=A0ABQ9EEB4_TEGGR|nr:hypothetical protein KUTeg_018789 [Tegillarca granosa]
MTKSEQPIKILQIQPVQVENIPSKKKLTESLLDDSRPLQYRNLDGYNDYVRNAAMNFSASTSMDIVLRYLYEQADLKNAQRDHGYFESPFAEYWITSEDVKELEIKTREGSGRQ